ncbi:MAG: hypothetical protein HYS27_23165 [Deltaproteobacteria bacterium]|nr:hypothetical protein [Deltaproteobacteria bacterium]
MLSPRIRNNANAALRTRFTDKVVADGERYARGGFVAQNVGDVPDLALDLAEYTGSYSEPPAFDARKKLDVLMQKLFWDHDAMIAGSRGARNKTTPTAPCAIFRNSPAAREPARAADLIGIALAGARLPRGASATARPTPRSTFTTSGICS